jgi:hypothetical protein
MAKSPAKNHKWVKIEKSGSITISFKYQGKSYKFAPVPRGRVENYRDVAMANKIASEIEMTVKLGKFEGLDQWRPKTFAERIEEHRPLTLTEVWQHFCSCLCFENF